MPSCSPGIKWLLDWTLVKPQLIFLVDFSHDYPKFIIMNGTTKCNVKGQISFTDHQVQVMVGEGGVSRPMKARCYV